MVLETATCPECLENVDYQLDSKVGLAHLVCWIVHPVIGLKPTFVLQLRYFAYRVSVDGPKALVYNNEIKT